jgi:hypothetical protein
MWSEDITWQKMAQDPKEWGTIWRSRVPMLGWLVKFELSDEQTPSLTFIPDPMGLWDDETANCK